MELATEETPKTWNYSLQWTASGGNVMENLQTFKDWPR